MWTTSRHTGFPSRGWYGFSGPSRSSWVFWQMAIEHQLSMNCRFSDCAIICHQINYANPSINLIKCTHLNKHKINIYVQNNDIAYFLYMFLILNQFTFKLNVPMTARLQLWRNTIQKMYLKDYRCSSNITLPRGHRKVKQLTKKRRFRKAKGTRENHRRAVGYWLGLCGWGKVSALHSAHAHAWANEIKTSVFVEANQ